MVQEKLLGKTCVSAQPGNVSASLWLVDSGATSHMCVSKEFFVVLDPSIKGFIELADACKNSEVHGKGSLTIKSPVGIRESPPLILKNVLFVP